MTTEKTRLTTSIEIDATKVTVDLETKQAIIVSNVSLVDDVVAQFSSKELLDAIVDHFDFSTVYDYVAEKLEEENELRDEE